LYRSLLVALMIGAVVTVIVLALGVGITSGFLGLGISAAFKEQEQQFRRSAVDLVNKIGTAWDDYVVAAGTIHGRCRNRDFTRRQFRDLYEYLIATGLSFQAAQVRSRILATWRSNVWHTFSALLS
jgi:hypothetical protein